MASGSIDKLDGARLGALLDNFQMRMGPRPNQDIWVSRAPGRVNLIGEHTDYNDGFVLPIAIDRDILMVGAFRGDSRMRVYAADMQEEVAFDLAANTFDQEHQWSNYVRGVLAVLLQAGYSVQGMDIVFTGSVPKGAGLSSSAALEVATAMLAQALCRLEIEPITMVKLAQQAENEFVGVRCGIMDQFISRLGRSGHALLIDCRSLEYTQIPWPESEVQLLVVDTRVERGLAGSAYNDRRRECETAARFFAGKLPGTRALRDVTSELLRKYGEGLDPVVRARATHVVQENERTLAATQALAAGDWARLGELMNQSHESLRTLYEVSCRELDAVVEIAQGSAGVYGARMTGGGFGGCAIVLAKQEAVPALEVALRREYQLVAGHEPGLLLTTPQAGAEAWPLIYSGQPRSAFQVKK